MKKNKKSSLPSGLCEFVPSSPMPTNLLISDKPPTADGKIEEKSAPLVEIFQKEFKRKWHDGVIVKKKELKQFARLAKSGSGQIETFTAEDHFAWTKEFYSKITLCKIDNEIGWGVFVLPGKTLKKGSRCLYGGQLDFTLAVLQHNTHAIAVHSCSEDLAAYMGPLEYGGLADFLNHGFNQEELIQFFELDPQLIPTISTINVVRDTMHYKGCPLSVLEVTKDVQGGQQLLWSYAQPPALLDNKQFEKPMRLFNKQGQVIPLDQYEFKYRQIAVYEKKSKKIFTSITSYWNIIFQLTHLPITPGADEYFTLANSSGEKWKIPLKLIQTQLMKNPDAVLIVFSTPPLKSAAPVLTDGLIWADQVEEWYSKTQATALWLNKRLPLPDSKSWEVRIHQPTRQLAALIPVAKEQVEAYVAHLGKFPNIIEHEKLITVDMEDAEEDKSYIGFLSTKWWALPLLPLSPFPTAIPSPVTASAGTPGSSSALNSSAVSALQALSITSTSARNPSPEAKDKRSLTVDQHEKAITTYRQLLGLYNKSDNSQIKQLTAMVHYGLSYHYLELGDQNAAKEQLLEALLLEPQNPQYSAELEKIISLEFTSAPPGS